MPVLSYWTIPYVSINDNRLIYLYNIGFVCVIGSLLGNIFVHKTYLESDALHGITEARIKTPKGWSPRIQENPFCKDNLCVKWDAEEVGYSYTSDSIFVTTRIKDSLEKSTCDEETQNRFRQLGNVNLTDDEEDTNDNNLENDELEDSVLECAEYKRVSKKYYYPFGVEEFYLVLNANAEALEFCSSIKLLTKNVEHCPYIYAMKKLPGFLESFNGTVLKTFGDHEETSESLKKIPISSFLEAAGVGALDEETLRDKGGVFMITVNFHLDSSKIGFLTGLFSSPTTHKLPTKFTVHVNKLAQAGYKVREVVDHSADHRRVRTYYGLHFKLMVAGKAERFSWSKLLSEIVMKFGLFGVVSTILDLLWQIVFPLVGFPDYNDLVYKSVKVKDSIELDKNEESNIKPGLNLDATETLIGNS